MWLLFAAAADKTTQIRMGPNVTHVILRDPAHVAQMAATLDQLTNGRAEIVVSFGNISMLPQHGIDTTGHEAAVARHRGAQGDARRCSTPAPSRTRASTSSTPGLWTLARPVQEHLPIKLGAMGGPRSFEVGGELFDGVHQAIGTSRETYQYMVDHVKTGAEKAGRNWRGPRPRGLAGDGGASRTRPGGQGDGPDHGRLLPRRRCPSSSSTGTASAARTSSRSSTRSPPATSRRRSS